MKIQMSLKYVPNLVRVHNWGNGKGAYQFTSHYLNLCWFIVNWNFGKEFSDILVKI